MTHTEELVAALAEGLRPTAAYLLAISSQRFTFSPEAAAEDLVAAIPPATRDKMLLGFAVEEFPASEHWVVTYQPPLNPTLRPEDAAFATAECGPAYGRGPTPLAAVEAANKEVDDE